MGPSDKPILIAPSILSADFAALGAEVAALQQAGADWIHVDVMDGHFVPNLTIGPAVIQAVAAHTSLPLDVHLMIEPVDDYIEAYVEAGASTLTVHLEACPHLDRTLDQIKRLGVRAGVALNPASSPEPLKWVAHNLDLVLAMTVNPGFGGQNFIKQVAPKVEQIRQLLGDEVDIEVDGGITPDTAGTVISAGANVLVAGSAVFASADYATNIAALRSAGST